MVFYNLRNPKGSSCYKNKPNNDGTGEKDKRGSNQSWARSFQHFSEKKMTNILGVKWVNTVVHASTSYPAWTDTAMEDSIFC